MMSIGKSRFRIALAAASALALTSCPSLNSSDTPPAPPDSGDGRAILDALGVAGADKAPVLTTVAEDGSARTIPDPDAWHPLKKPVTVFSPKAELFVLGFHQTDAAAPGVNYYHGLYQDGAALWAASRPLKGDHAWEEATRKMTCAADLDGNGIREFVVLSVPGGVASPQLALRVVDSEGSSAPLNVPIAVSMNLGYWKGYAMTIAGIGTYCAFRMGHLEAGDLDGDGRDEVLFADSGKLHVLRVRRDGTGASVVESRDFLKPISGLAAGDVDGDGKDEFALCFGDGSAAGSFALYDSSVSRPMTVPEFTSLPDPLGTAGSACFGDFDGDGVAELCVASFKAGAAAPVLAKIYEWSKAAGTPSLVPGNAFGPDKAMGNPWNHFFSCIRAVEWDGDGRDELFMAGSVFDGLAGVPTSTVPYSPINYYDVQAADVDGDDFGSPKEELVYSVIDRRAADANLWNRVVAVGQNSAGTSVVKKEYGPFLRGSDAQADAVSICAADVDADSCRVRYAGHELQFTNPIVIAALASPPYYAEIAANDQSYGYGDWTTTFGKFVSSGEAESTRVGFSVGTTVEFEQEASIFGIKLASFKASVSFSAAKNWEWTTTTEIVKSITYSCVGGEDRVVFTSVPIDVYSYEVVESPDAADRGRMLTVELPRRFATYTVERSYFNDKNGTLPDIGADVFPHTLGKPSTYMKEARKNELAAAYKHYAYDPQPVGQAGPSGGGCTTIGIEVSKGEEKSEAVDFSVEASVGGGAGGVTVLANLGFNTGYSYTTSAAEGTAFGGTVGYLPAKYYEQAAYNYSSGLIAYLYKDPASYQTYWVVNYFME